MTGRGLGYCVVRLDGGRLPDTKTPEEFQNKMTHSAPSTKNKAAKEDNMPAGDGTGPLGMGPMTGRAAGFCAGYGMPGYMNRVPGRGFGMGFGRGAGGGWGGRGGGRGRRNMYYATGLTGWQRASAGWPIWGAMPPAAAPTPAQEKDGLKSQAEYLENALAGIRSRIEELEKEKPVQ